MFKNKHIYFLLFLDEPQVLLALQCVHGVNYLHRDLKPSNLVIHIPDRINIPWNQHYLDKEFGDSEIVDSMKAKVDLFAKQNGVENHDAPLVFLIDPGLLIHQRHNHAQNRSGTYVYFAPELLEGVGSAQRTGAADLFALGVSALSLVAGMDQIFQHLSYWDLGMARQKVNLENLLPKRSSQARQRPSIFRSKLKTSKPRFDVPTRVQSKFSKLLLEAGLNRVFERSKWYPMSTPFIRGMLKTLKNRASVATLLSRIQPLLKNKCLRESIPKLNLQNTPCDQVLARFQQQSIKTFRYKAETGAPTVPEFLNLYDWTFLANRIAACL
jgi:serine/threonine protein kinase